MVAIQLDQDPQLRGLVTPGHRLSRYVVRSRRESIARPIARGHRTWCRPQNV